MMSLECTKPSKTASMLMILWNYKISKQSVLLTLARILGTPPILVVLCKSARTECATKSLCKSLKSPKNRATSALSRHLIKKRNFLPMWLASEHHCIVSSSPIYYYC